MDQKVEQHIEEVLAKLRGIFTQAANTLDQVKDGEKIIITQLAKDLATFNNLKQDQMYHLLRFLRENYPGFLNRGGAHGGMIRLPLKNNSEDKK